MKVTPTGYISNLMNHIRCCMGAGVFALGYAIKPVGLGIGPPILIFFGIVHLHCQHMLFQCTKMEQDMKLEPSTPVMERFYIVKDITILVAILVQASVFCLNMMVFAKNMEIVSTQWGYDVFSSKFWTVLAFPMLFLATSNITNLYENSYVSTFVNFLVLTSVGCAVYITRKEEPSSPSYVWLGEWNKLPLIASVGAMTFTASPIVVLSYEESDDPESMDSLFGSLNVSVIFEVFVSVAMGVLSYRRYGNECEKNLLDNLEKGTTQQIATMCLGIGLLLSSTINIYIIKTNLLPFVMELFDRYEDPDGFGTLLKVIILILLFSCLLVVPRFEKAIEIWCTVGFATVGILTPTILHMILRWDQSGYLEKTKNFSLLILGVSCAGIALNYSVSDLFVEGPVAPPRYIYYFM